jgi:hypothetical protein
LRPALAQGFAEQLPGRRIGGIALDRFPQAGRRLFKVAGLEILVAQRIAQQARRRAGHRARLVISGLFMEISLKEVISVRPADTKRSVGSGFRYYKSRASDSRTSPRPLAGEGSGGEMGNSRSMLRAHRAISACKPECALQGRGTVMAFIFRVNRDPAFQLHCRGQHHGQNDHFNSRRRPAAIGTYSQAVKVGDTVYLSGQIGLDPVSMKLVEGHRRADRARL